MNVVRCLTNEGYPASLIVGKAYRRLPDPEAETHRMIRILDEDAGEPDGYLYPAAWFEPIEPGPSGEPGLTNLADLLYSRRIAARRGVMRHGEEEATADPAGVPPGERDLVPGGRTPAGPAGPDGPAVEKLAGA